MSSIVSDALPDNADHLPRPWPVAAWAHAGDTAPSRWHATPQLILAPRGLEIRVPIRDLDDIVKARRSGRLLARQLDYSGSREALLLTAISELARNILSYAGSGEIILARSSENGKASVVVIARDEGPGIENVTTLLDTADSNPFQGQRGRGLRCLKACMDRFHISSTLGAGTRVTCEVFANRMA